MILDVTVFPVLDHGGKIMNIVVQHIDITERKRMEETLRSSEERFRTLLEVSPTGFWATDPFGKNTYVSPYWTKLAGISKEDARGDGWSSDIHPDDKDAIFTGWSKAALKEEPYVSEFRFIHPDGQSVWVLCQALAVKRVDEPLPSIGLPKSPVCQQFLWSYFRFPGVSFQKRMRRAS
jgi:two-component system sensor histidine kinase/response regulator